MAEAAETKKIVNPRVEIDTSPPFESVKEAVDRFGGSGPWIPHHLLRLPNAHHDSDGFDVEKMEEQAMELERDLIMKQQQTLNVFKQLQDAKRLVEALKLNSIQEELLSSLPQDSSCMSPGVMFVELNQAKLNLDKTSIDLAEIQASVESLNKKLRKDKHLLRTKGDERCLWVSRNASIAKKEEISTALYSGVNFDVEAEQLKNMTEGSRYEVMKAMEEIERTKNSIKMAEMRLNAAKKMEEAAKAVEVVAIAERLHNRNGINLPLEEYKTLVQKAKQAEELYNPVFVDTKGIDQADEAHPEEPVLEKFEETIKEHKEGNGNNFTKFMFRNSHKYPADESCETKEMSNPGFRSTASIGEVLRRKFILQDQAAVKDSIRGHVSLSEMLSEQCEVIVHPTSNTRENGSMEKQYSVRRMKFGFIKKKTSLPV